MVTENRTLLEKADLALSDLSSGGLLLAEQAQKLVEIAIKAAAILPMATVVPMKNPSRLIEKIYFGSRILRPGVEATALAASDRTKPDLGKVELAAKLFKAEVRLDDETLEDNIERGSLKDTVLRLIGTRIATDMDEVIIQGDTTSADLFLKQFNGIVKQASSNTVDASAAKLNKGILRDCIKTMPSEFLRTLQRMKFLTSVDAQIDYRDSLADRVGVLSDDVMKGMLQVPYSGIDVVSIPMMPENVGTGSHCTYVLFCDPKNINVGIHRDVKLETDRDISAGVLKIVASLRFDVKWGHEPAVVKAYNVSVT